MKKVNWKKNIVVDKNICHGKPHIKDTRISVELILNMLASGMNIDEIIKEYPQLKESEIRSCIAYSAELASERDIA